MYRNIRFTCNYVYYAYVLFIKLLKETLGTIISDPVGNSSHYFQDFCPRSKFLGTFLNTLPISELIRLLL
jgi:hypothetical protein